jgi:hypothetical protein
MPIRTATNEIAEVIGFNATILSVTTFTNLEILLKILLLLVTIGYTVNKWVYHIKRNGKK